MRARSLFAWIACVLLSAGCSGADPPYHELPLRDALTAEPEVIASMPEEARKELAARFEDARRAQRDDEALPGEVTDAPSTLIQLADDARAARGDDALIAASLREGDRARVVRPLSTAITGDAPDLPPLAGSAGEATADLEERSLHGRAGAVIGELLHSSGATRLVRVTAWPVGAAAAGDAVYVNASWLVALSPDQVKAAGLPPPVLKPMSVGGNPYLTYGSLEACVATVNSRCNTCLKSGPCDAHATLRDLADGKAECTFLSKDSARTQQLCALALLSIGSIGDCVRSRAPTCSIPGAANVSTNLPEADAFIMDPTCIEALDLCVGGTPTPKPSVDLDIKEPTCQDPFSSCASAFKGLSDACSSHSCSANDQSCTSCSSCKSTSGSDSCSSCNSGGSTGSGSSCDSCKSSSGGGTSSGSNNCKCEVRAAEETPFGAIVWLLAPLAFVLTRARRPS